MNELRVGTPVVVAGVTLIPVERLWVDATSQRQAFWLQATKEVFALVICDAQGPRAVDTGGQFLFIENLIEVVPGLQNALPIS